ncbi:hypothetical protein CPB85DRAFT_1292743 [Mucidula mucida]|nr:hypothetical protein CPB85DRAFT_1292743 [Mucidula mucida]
MRLPLVAKRCNFLKAIADYLWLILLGAFLISGVHATHLRTINTTTYVYRNLCLSCLESRRCVSCDMTLRLAVKQPSLRSWYRVKF